MQTKLLTFLIFISSSLCYAQQDLVFKDFKHINLEDLNTEGPVGALMMKGHLTTNLDSTIYYVSKAKTLAKKAKDTLLLPYINYHYGYAYFNKQDYPVAKKYLEKCIALANTHNLNGMLYESYNLLALIDKSQAQFNTSILYFEKALQYAASTTDSLQIKINIASIYLDTNKPEVSKLYLDEVFASAKKTPNSIDPYWLVFANLNYVYLVDNYQSKLNYTLIAIENATLIEDQHLLLQCNMQLATLYFDFKKYTKAIALAKTNLRLAKTYQFEDSILRAYLLLAKLYLVNKNHQVSIKYVDSITAIADPEWRKIELTELMYNNLYGLSNYKKAFLEAKKQALYVESLLKEKDEVAYAKYAKKYETELKTKENHLLTQENQIQALTILREEEKRNFLFAIALAAGLGLFIMYYRYTVKQKTASMLAIKNKTIKSQNKELEKANQAKQQLFSIISHDLINPFNAILGYTKLLNENYNDFNKQEKQQFIKTIDKYALQNFNLTKNLLNWARAQQNKIVINKEFFNIHQLVTNAIAAYLSLAESKHIKTIITIDKSQQVFADIGILTTVIINLYSNAIKYTPINGNITIASSVTKTNVFVSIKDTGVGMSKAQIETILSSNQTNTTLGTNYEKGTGLGLLVCKAFLAMHQATLTINSELHEGTEITIDIPV